MICGKLVINCRSMKNKQFSLTLLLSHTEQTHAGKFRNVTHYSKCLNTTGLFLQGSFLIAAVALAHTSESWVTLRVQALWPET